MLLWTGHIHQLQAELFPKIEVAGDKFTAVGNRVPHFCLRMHLELSIIQKLAQLSRLKLTTLPSE